MHFAARDANRRFQRLQLRFNGKRVHTSAVLPPILTLMRFASSYQSQAVPVFSTMPLLSMNTRSPHAISRPRRKREPLSESLATCSSREDEVLGGLSQAGSYSVSDQRALSIAGSSVAPLRPHHMCPYCTSGATGSC